MNDAVEVPDRADRKTVSASNAANTALDMLTKVHHWFEDGIEAYRVAIAVALARGLSEDDVPERVNATTKYNVGSLDPEGRIRDLISIMRPQDSVRPYAVAEWLAEAGLAYILRQLEDGALLSEVLQPPQDAATGSG